MRRHHVLLLNADANPVSLLPLSSITWQNAIRLIWLDIVDVLHVYENWQVHSPSITIDVPSVIMLRKQVKGFHTWMARENSPQSYLIFLRDLFVCQYCMKQFPRGRLTMDHVMPRHHGGRTQWKNITTACDLCNQRRGSDYRIRPATMPFRPTLNQLIRNLRTFPLKIPHPSWNHYLHWDDHLIQITTGIIDDDCFEEFPIINSITS